ncbi:MAG: hypothetical protein K6T78_09340 [Alicyclobacillus sp.]|nr:hypothetical protein [Alicyclobacillus sp.]
MSSAQHLQEPFRPMEPVMVHSFVDVDAYLYQVKWDGVRMLCHIAGSVQLWNRKQRPRTSLYPDLCSTLASLRLPQDTVLDGEVVSLGEDGRPNFHRVLKRDLAARPHIDIPVWYMVFDCLQAGGRDLTGLPLETRLNWLDQYLPATGVVQRIDRFTDGPGLLARMADLGMEGVVAKRRGSVYRLGQKHPDWQKHKCWRTMWVPSVGVQMRPDGTPASLWLANPDQRGSVIGRAASGMNRARWRAVMAHCDRTGRLAPDVEVWAEVRFLEWTDSGQLRAPTVERLEVRAGGSNRGERH